MSFILQHTPGDLADLKERLNVLLKQQENEKNLSRAQSVKSGSSEVVDSNVLNDLRVDVDYVMGRSTIDSNATDISGIPSLVN